MKELNRDEHEYPPLPEELEYLLEPAIHYGRKYKFDDEVQRFLENADDSEIESLAILAERARLSGDYTRFQQWTYEVDGFLDRIVDENYPYSIDIPERRRKELMHLINEANDPPDVAERWREKRLRMLVEATDHSDLVGLRREMRGRLITKANDKVHHMDIYFLFGLMDACDMNF